MNALTKQRQSNIGGDPGFPGPTAGPSQPLPQERSVIVLGVMLPSATLQVGEDTPDNWLCLPRDVTTGHRSTDVIFYDPISAVGSDDPTRQRDWRAIGESSRPSMTRKKSNDGRDVSRMKALEAVARDLAMLSMQKRG